MSPKNRPTQSDVARLAGVSRATVSFVLNGTSGNMIPISEETRTRVLEAAKALNYAPDPVAQMLASGSNRLIGVFTYEEAFPFERSDFYYEFILGIERAAARFDYNVILFTRHGGQTGDQDNSQRQVYATGSNSLRLADGTIFLGATPIRAELANLSKEQYPFVYIGRREVPGCEIDWVAADYLPAAREAAEFLLSLGHRRMAYIGSDTHTESNQDKIHGIRQAVDQVSVASLEVFPESVLGDSRQMQQLLQQSQATAILCSHSATYDTTLTQLQENGCQVPRDISVISLADANASRCFPITPTYISIDRQRWGERAVELLLDKINGKLDQPRQERLPCKLIIGTSAAARPE